MTVFENIAFGLRVKKKPDGEVRERVRDAAEAMRITKLLEKKPAECSGGEAQRVALARTIITHPSVFLMDEPLSSLDAKLRVDMRTELKQLHEHLKATFVYVTHDQAEAMTMADRIIVMRDGLIQQSGGPLDIYGKPVNQFVAGFFGTPTMNFVEGALEGSGDSTVFKAKGLEQAIPSGSGVSNGGRSATLGVRSEHVQVGQGANHGKVTITQPLGDITLVFFEYGGEAILAAQVNPDLTFNPGDKITFGFDENGFHIFDGESGDRLN
jgi:multiple sugar transport system ATP-binding protein